MASQVADRLQSIASSPCLQNASLDVAPLLHIAVRLREIAGPRAGGSSGSIAKALNQLGAVLMVSLALALTAAGSGNQPAHLLRMPSADDDADPPVAFRAKATFPKQKKPTDAL